jgi:hypothetical protein
MDAVEQKVVDKLPLHFSIVMKEAVNVNERNFFLIRKFPYCGDVGEERSLEAIFGFGIVGWFPIHLSHLFVPPKRIRCHENHGRSIVSQYPDKATQVGAIVVERDTGLCRRKPLPHIDGGIIDSELDDDNFGIGFTHLLFEAGRSMVRVVAANACIDDLHLADGEFRFREVVGIDF